MSNIETVFARQILDSRGNPTIEVDVTTDDGFFGRAAVPSGASTGSREALELRDGDATCYHGKSVLKALENVNETISEAIYDFDVFNQQAVDETMIALDGTPNKSKLGANAILATSMAVCRAAAMASNTPLFRYLGGSMASKMPVPLMNVINGGAHANNNLDVQEFMLVPDGVNSFSEALKMGVEIYQTLKKILTKMGLSTAVGDEGGFAPNLQNNKEALKILVQAISDAGYTPGKHCSLAMDVAASELLDGDFYSFDGKKIPSKELNMWYKSMIGMYPLVSIEDGMAEQDREGWIQHTEQLNEIQLIGDDVFVTNPNIFAEGIKSKIANAILIKLNQVGTVTETWKTINMAKDAGYKFIISHRSGETADSFISHLAVASGSGQIKTGAPARGERVEKYNELLRIGETLGNRSCYGY